LVGRKGWKGRVKNRPKEEGRLCGSASRMGATEVRGKSKEEQESEEQKGRRCRREKAEGEDGRGVNTYRIKRMRKGCEGE
jgi:hypothetical protein